ncbi:MAG: hypothetical protein ACYC75_03090 [Minisyncoccota bacterium]
MENNDSLLVSSSDTPLAGVPSHKAQSWGAIISIVVIVLMIIVGAFYAWGNRIAQQNAPAIPAATQQ